MTDHVPDRLAVEKRLPAPPFPEISNGAPGVETLIAVVYGEGVARGRITVERMVDLLKERADKHLIVHGPVVLTVDDNVERSFARASAETRWAGAR